MFSVCIYSVESSLDYIYARNRQKEKVQFAGQAFCVMFACFPPACVGSLQVPHHPPTFKDKHGSFNWLLLSECGRECLFVAPCD